MSGERHDYRSPAPGRAVWVRLAIVALVVVALVPILAPQAMARIGIVTDEDAPAESEGEAAAVSHVPAE